MKNISLLIGIFIFFTSCGYHDIGLPPEYKETPHNFIESYLIPARVSVLEHSKIGNNQVLEIRFWGKCINKLDNPDLFDHYVRLYGDTLCYATVLPGSNAAIADAFSKISVVADADFDAAHPAGTPLDDIICLRSESAYEYIRTGYEYPYADRKMAYLNCRKPLSELTQNDMTLMRYQSVLKKNPHDEEYYVMGGMSETGLMERERYHNLALSFLTQPDTPGTYKLMFSFTKVDGTVLTCSTLLSFD